MFCEKIGEKKSLKGECKCIRISHSFLKRRRNRPLRCMDVPLRDNTNLEVFLFILSASLKGKNLLSERAN